MASATEHRTAKLRCTVRKGMFSHEAGVVIEGASHRYESLVDRRMLTEPAVALDASPRPGFVQIKVVEERGEQILVEIPGQVVTGASRIWVPKSQVVF